MGSLPAVLDVDLEALAERALGHAGGDAQAAAVHRRRVGGGRLDEAVTVEVTCVAGGAVGSARTTRLDDAGLAAAAAAAREATAGAPGAEPHPGLPAPLPGRPHDGWDPAVAALAPGAEGGVEAWAERTAIASAAGVRASERRTWARRGDRLAVRLADLDRPPALDPLPAPAGEAMVPVEGEWPAVLGPVAVAALLETLGRTAFNGLRVARGDSPLGGRLGTRVAASAINLSESPRYTGTLPRSYDAEGTPVQPVPLIQDGVAHRVVHDSRSAAAAGGGAASTGHALRAGGDPDGPAPRNLVLVGGGAETLAELAAPVADGLYVEALRDVHTLDETGVISAVLEGCVLRGAEPAAPLKPMRFTGAPLALLASVEALTMRQALVAGGTVCPAMRVPALPVEPV